MPIREVDAATIVDEVKDANTSPQYLLFFASGEPPWCPDCRHALPALEKVFGSDGAPLLTKILVGQRDEWKSPSNRWRAAPFHVDQTPTVIKFVKGKEVQRLGDQDSQSEGKLRELLQAA